MGSMLQDSIASDLPTALTAALTQHSERFASLLSHVPVFAWMAEESGRVAFVNPRMERYFGLSAGALLGKTIFDLFPEAVAREIAAREHAVLQAGHAIENIEDVPDYQGRMSTWWVCRFPVQGPSGRMIGGVALEITDRYEAERALREAEERHRQILDALTDWVFVKGPHSKIVWANRAFREGYGMSNEQLQGMIDAPFNAPDYTQQYVKDDAQVFSSGKMMEIAEERVTRHDGKVLTVNTVKAPIFDANGNVVMTVGVSRDITERKQLEAKLKLADHMASLGTLAAGVAHEVNSPLASIIANLDMLCEELRRGASGTGVLELATHARDGAERVRKIVRGLRTFSLSEDGPLKAIDLSAVIEASINLTWNEIRNRGRIIRDFAVTLPIRADETRLAQVFINLLLNAAHALDEASADSNEIRIRTYIDAARRVVIEFQDTGAGIPAAMLPRIFDPFYSTKAIGAGMGLGLSICHGIVTGLGGQLSCESELGKGSVFRVALPASLEPELAPTPAVPKPAKEARQGRVLIIDDDPMVGACLGRALQREHEVVKLSSAHEALERIGAGERFDAIFCDLMMPVMTGMEFYASLRVTSPEHCERIVFITGGAFSSGARTFLEQAHVQWLEKPFDIDRVREAARRFVE
jgi:PAS domain S-box-containing protein